MNQDFHAREDELNNAALPYVARVKFYSLPGWIFFFPKK